MKIKCVQLESDAFLTDLDFTKMSPAGNQGMAPADLLPANQERRGPL